MNILLYFYIFKIQKQKSEPHTPVKTLALVLDSYKKLAGFLEGGFEDELTAIVTRENSRSLFF